jgi:hypothetical protein
MATVRNVESVWDRFNVKAMNVTSEVLLGEINTTTTANFTTNTIQYNTTQYNFKKSNINTSDHI